MTSGEAASDRSGLRRKKRPNRKGVVDVPEKTRTNMTIVGLLGEGGERKKRKVGSCRSLSQNIMHFTNTNNTTSYLTAPSLTNIYTVSTPPHFLVESASQD
ncbi:hypothetical protein Pmani_004861 [Petrolisthes manimaculis]|uniref:Uncharacterized protein n=1 Tax=Petrolisthes manimaculis TaxID=1843537 RepID=A0AAE1UL63_9EUCA|nr:hypothetical protein Pmani_004861 [Petrolisthes manimaculis]